MPIRTKHYLSKIPIMYFTCA